MNKIKQTQHKEMQYDQNMIQNMLFKEHKETNKSNHKRATEP